MCFSIPIKVISVKSNTALLETGKTIHVDNTVDLKQGQYVRMIGDVIVDHVSKKDGNAIRRLIRELYKDNNE